MAPNDNAKTIGNKRKCPRDFSLEKNLELFTNLEIVKCTLDRKKIIFL